MQYGLRAALARSTSLSARSLHGAKVANTAMALPPLKPLGIKPGAPVKR